SFLSNSDVTNFISEPSTLKLWLISRRDFLNSRSPSTPILRPKLSAILPPPPKIDIRKEQSIDSSQIHVLILTLCCKAFVLWFIFVMKYRFNQAQCKHAKLNVHYNVNPSALLFYPHTNVFL